MNVKDPFRRYHDAVARLERCITPPTAQSKSNDYMHSDGETDQAFFLHRMKYLLQQLGEPQRGFEIVHVTGSSGKGSTSTMIYESLLASGKTVGLYLSPFVTTTVENIQLNGQLLSPDEFADEVDAIMPVVEEIVRSNPRWMPSYAEVLFAIALSYFKHAQVDGRCEWLVVEVGCGGRFDKTNAIPPPRAAVITNISLDHTDLLGKRLEDIAWHKAGIIKQDSLIFSGETNPSVQKVINAEAATYNATVQYIVPASSAAIHEDTLMLGEHQQSNAALVRAVCRALGVASEAITRGIHAARMPARIEQMQEQPRVIIDGAHSAAKISALVNTLPQFKPWRQLHIIFAGKETKDLTDLLTPLARMADQMHMTSFTLPGFQSHSPQEAAELCQQIAPALPVDVEPNSMKALTACLQHAHADDLILITGSLYLAGELRTHWIPEHAILAARNSFPTTH